MRDRSIQLSPLSSLRSSMFASPTPSQSHQLVLRRRAPSVVESTIESEDDVDVSYTRRLTCRCDKLVPLSLKTNLNKIGKIPMDEVVQLLGRYRTATGRIEHPKVCWDHTVKMGSKVGLMIKGLNLRTLTARLLLILDQKERIGELKTGNQTY
jgi:hypothetical protein